MKIPILGRIFSREDLNLKSKWWHKLLSIVFVVQFIYFIGYNIVDFSTHDMFRGGHAQQWNKVAALSERITPEIKPISELIKAGEKIGEDNRTYVLSDQIDGYYKMILNDVYCSTELSEDYEEVKSARNIDELYIGGSFGRNKVSSDEFSKHIKQSAIKCLIVDGYLSSDNKNVAILNPDKSYQDNWSFYEKAPLKTAIYFVEMIAVVLAGSIAIFTVIAMVYYKAVSYLISNKNIEEDGRDKRTTLPTKFLIGLIIGFVIAYIAFHNKDSNARLEYGATGFPKNCRAIIKANYEGWYLKEYTADEALGSINRNCGEFGSSWGR